MNSKTTETNLKHGVKDRNASSMPRDWEKSDWFRRWLELIRGGKTQGAAC